MKTFTASLVAGLAAKAAAHGIVTKITIGTQTYQGYDPSFQVSDLLQLAIYERRCLIGAIVPNTCPEGDWLELASVSRSRPSARH
jgi:hypothetical protein